MTQQRFKNLDSIFMQACRDRKADFQMVNLTGDDVIEVRARMGVKLRGVKIDFLNRKFVPFDPIGEARLPNAVSSECPQCRGHVRRWPPYIGPRVIGHPKWLRKKGVEYAGCGCLLVPKAIWEGLKYMRRYVRKHDGR